MTSHEIPEWAITKRKTLAPAIVLRWNDTSAVVICPFPTCQKLHTHGSERARDGYPNSRLSHCQKLQQEYQLIWPFEIDGVAKKLDLGFELDRDEGVWKTIGTALDYFEFGDSTGDLAPDAVRSHPSDADLLESLDGLTLDEKKYAWFISHCVTGEIHQATRCLKSTKSPGSFLRKKDSDGNTALALACMQGNYDIVEFLLDQGSAKDSKNEKNETPLIISLRHGRGEIARRLISRGASVLSRDVSGASVLAHAKELRERLEETRIYACMPSFSTDTTHGEVKHLRDSGGNIVMTYYEDPNPSPASRYRKHQEEVDCVQRIINACVVHETIRKRIEKHKRTRERRAQAMKVSISRSTVKAMVTVFQNAYEIPIADGKKTFAYLDRGEAHDLVFAVSGWSGGQFAEIDGCVDRKLWTERVFEFSRIVGHNLICDTWDEYGRQGSFHACHAEKQLMAFVLWHYTSLQAMPDQKAPEAEKARYARVNKLHHCIDDSTHPVISGTKHCDRYCGPPVELVTPVIYVTNVECSDCMSFRSRIREFTGIKITVKMVANID
ncbi:hypothetical protein BDU57DRAFT_489246 [Ampelomyces quisqualis]|uniref:Single-strand DNA deaminase toxin A-like C-terminal domain-containing protein n=1 Tax=Ampelomyces quisqualis TaxID=50730 RepID=A0A6A5R231_AMPQU|nr:hypothetical protein BDU57DRAFT_489246 [Ampelomyces quisqualis]